MARVLLLAGGQAESSSVFHGFDLEAVDFHAEEVIEAQRGHGDGKADDGGGERFPDAVGKDGGIHHGLGGNHAEHPGNAQHRSQQPQQRGNNRHQPQQGHGAIHFFEVLVIQKGQLRAPVGRAAPGPGGGFGENANERIAGACPGGEVQPGGVALQRGDVPAKDPANPTEVNGVFHAQIDRRRRHGHQRHARRANIFVHIQAIHGFPNPIAYNEINARTPQKAHCERYFLSYLHASKILIMAARKRADRV